MVSNPDPTNFRGTAQDYMLRHGNGGAPTHMLTPDDHFAAKRKHNSYWNAMPAAGVIGPPKSSPKEAKERPVDNEAIQAGEAQSASGGSMPETANKAESGIAKVVLAILGTQRTDTGGFEAGDMGRRLRYSLREFKDHEKQRLLERKKRQGDQDRTAKLNEFLRFSQTFEVPDDLDKDLPIARRSQKRASRTMQLVTPSAILVAIHWFQTLQAHCQPSSPGSQPLQGLLNEHLLHRRETTQRTIMYQMLLLYCLPPLPTATIPTWFGQHKRYRLPTGP